jgi:hypothetical protein
MTSLSCFQRGCNSNKLDDGCSAMNLTLCRRSPSAWTRSACVMACIHGRLSNSQQSERAVPAVNASRDTHGNKHLRRSATSNTTLLTCRFPAATTGRAGFPSGNDLDRSVVWRDIQTQLEQGGAAHRRPPGSNKTMSHTTHSQK